MLGTGMRVGEIVGLRWCDINFEENLISVNHTLVYYSKGDNNDCSYAVNTPKTKAGERTIPMLESVKEAFLKEKSYQDEVGISCSVEIDGYTDFIFVNRFGNVQNQGTLNTVFIFKLLTICVRGIIIKLTLVSQAEEDMKQESTKDKILKKALELFSTHGYDSVSVGEIAKAVGIKAPSLYNHFSCKQAIFDAIVEDTAAQYEKYTDGIDIHVQDAKKDFDVFSHITEDKLCQKVRQIFLYSLHDEEISRFRRMMTIEQFRSKDLSNLYSYRYVERLVKYHAKIFESLIKNGEIRNENPENLAIMYISPVITLLGICDRQPEREAECLEKLDAHVSLFFRMCHSRAE